MEENHQEDRSIEKKRRINITIIEDRLSSLPDALLVEIVNRLLLKKAAGTSVLSHRWRYLWTQRDRLHFEFPTWSGSNGYKDFKTVFTMVDTILRQITSPKIRSFHLKFPNPSPGEETDMCSSFLDSWVTQICARNPEEIEVTFGNIKTFVPLPSLVFQCQSLVKLKFSGSFSCKLSNDGVFCLPNLKELLMEYLDMDLKLMEALIRSCPVLDSLRLTLTLRTDDDCLIISVQNLEFLRIFMSESSKYCKVVVFAPKLEGFSLHGDFVGYRFIGNPSALYSANIGCGSRHSSSRGDILYPSKIACFLQGISNVRYMHLHGNLGMFSVCNNLYPNVLQTFRNLIRLTLQNILTRELDWPSPIPACLLSRVEWLEVVELRGNSNGLKLLKYILRNAPVLETLHADIRCCDGDEGEEFEKENIWMEYKFCKSLFDFPRKSLACEIKFHALSIRASSNDYKDGSLSCRINSDFWDDSD